MPEMEATKKKREEKGCIRSGPPGLGMQKVRGGERPRAFPSY